MSGLIGRKVGMTRIFDDQGTIIPVTVVEAGPCSVVQLKTAETDGYAAVQMGFEARKAKRTTAPEMGHAKKAGLEAAPRILREFPVSEGDSYELGQALTVDVFQEGDTVKVTGTSKGKGFQGVVKRYGFAGRPGGHGHPMSRNPGSIGPGTNPSRVIKGKKLPGRMGGAQTSIRKVKIMKVDSERNLLFVKGAVPGSRHSVLYISK